MYIHLSVVQYDEKNIGKCAKQATKQGNIYCNNDECNYTKLFRFV